MSLQVEHRSLDAEAPMTNTSRTSRRLRSSWANSPLTPGWPIVTALVGLPLWWVLGLTQLIFFLMAVPMAIYLLRLRVIATPRSFGIWLLLLVWMLAGLFVLQVDAPGAVPGGSSSRYLTFAYRGGWYVVATIAMLYVINTRHVFSTSRVSGALSYAFLIFIAGGYLGILLPSLEFPSLLRVGPAEQPSIEPVCCRPCPCPVGSGPRLLGLRQRKTERPLHIHQRMGVEYCSDAALFRCRMVAQRWPLAGRHASVACRGRGAPHRLVESRVMGGHHS